MSRPHRYFRITCLFIIFLLPNYSFSQREEIKGQVLNINNDVANVLIINLNSKKSTITDSLGSFTIKARLRDSIRFTALQYQMKEIVITESVLLKKIIRINLTEKIIELNEVTVTPYNLTGKIDTDLKRLGIKPMVTSSTLGLPNADLEVMTQSERLLIEADRGKYVYYYGTAFVINTHKIMNKLTGRTKSFEKMVLRDQNMELEKEIVFKFSKETLSESFNIPQTNIDGFLTFCSSQSDFYELSNARSSKEIWEYLKEKSVAFKESNALKD